MSEIDHSRYFLPEQLTPLYHTGEYLPLPERIRLRYNQLCALNYQEHLGFFGENILRPVLTTLARRGGLPEPLRESFAVRGQEEQEFTRLFQLLNLRSAPELYRRSPYFFHRVPWPGREVLTWMTARPLLYPMLAWLILLHTERTLFVSRCYLADAPALESQFVQAHRLFLVEGVSRLRWGEELVEALWKLESPRQRRLNARLFGWLVGRYFYLPRWTGLRVVERLRLEFPERPRTELRPALLALARSPAYHRSIYSRATVPRTFAQMDQWEEFRELGKYLRGYAPPER